MSMGLYMSILCPWVYTCLYDYKSMGLALEDCLAHLSASIDDASVIGRQPSVGRPPRHARPHATPGR